MHLSQIDATATYDAERNMLEITGKTDTSSVRTAAMVAMHVAFKQDSDGEIKLEGHGLVPDDCLDAPMWMARYPIAPDAIELGAATVYAVAIGYAPENGSLQTQTWAQAIEVQAGQIYPDPRWDPPASESDDDAVAVA